MASTTTEQSRMRFGARCLHGTTFLTFEHCMYFALVILLPGLLLLGAAFAMQLWSGSYDAADTLSYALQADVRGAKTTGAVVIAAALLVLTPLFVIFRRRIMAEYSKRPGYINRVAYKLPIYSALAVLFAQAVVLFVVMLGVFLNSLVSIGVSGVDIGAMYTGEFLPALMGFAVVGATGWYVLWFAKGKDLSRPFVGALSILSAALVVALLVTALTVNHNTTKSTPTNPIQIQPYPYQPDGANQLPY